MPGDDLGYIDYTVVPDVEYCYTVTQVDLEIETGASNEACATPGSIQILPPPTNLNGFASGMGVSLEWDVPSYEIGSMIIDHGDSHGEEEQVMQGGEDIETATVIHSLPISLSGSTIGGVNSYDEECPYTGSTSSDVVYSITPGTVSYTHLTLPTKA